MKKAFTLFEIIIVLVVVGVIASMAVYKLFFSVSKAIELSVPCTLIFVEEGRYDETINIQNKENLPLKFLAYQFFVF